MQKQKLLHVILAVAVASSAMPACALTRHELREQQKTSVPLQAVILHPPATETLRGVVDSVDEGSDTLLIRLSPDRTEPFKVQDGLIFNAVRFGDSVAISVQTISGFRTIVGLSKQ
ncbi:hypothetical protein [Bradyrhizobium mercantei]|uniref:hypothetical protein n=1 Tax=Bradyrhizobium mercantei TaxID=1904807 RepID=UPI000977D1E6|nr:hypothetical protein [Bradyrhizobium mercantei]